MLTEYADTPEQFGRRGRVLTPSNTDLSPIPKGIVCLTGGNVTVVPWNNANADTIAFVGVSAGFIVPYRVRRVTAATATVATIE